MPIPNRARERIVTGLKRLVPIVAQQKARDVSEADTVTLVKDLLSEVMGYDKYAELTSEHAIRGTYCDLAVKIDDKLSMLIEVKAAGSELDDRHVKQAIDYAANAGEGSDVPRLLVPEQSRNLRSQSSRDFSSVYFLSKSFGLR